MCSSISNAGSGWNLSHDFDLRTFSGLLQFFDKVQKSEHEQVLGEDQSIWLKAMFQSCCLVKLVFGELPHCCNQTNNCDNIELAWPLEMY